MEYSKKEELLDYFILGTVILTIFITELVIYFFSGEINLIVAHLFYFPVIFIAFRYPKRGIILSTFLAFLYLGFIYLIVLENPTQIIPATMQFYVFVSVGIVISSFSRDLKLNEMKYRNIFNNSATCVLIVDGDTGTILQSNSRCGQFAGNPEQFNANILLSRLWCTDEERKEFFKRLRTVGAIFDHEMKITTADNVNHDVLVSAGVLSDTEYILTMSDITMRKRAEERDQKSLETLGFLAKTAIDFVEYDYSADLYPYIASRLFALSPHAIVFVVSHENGTDTVTVEAMSGMEQDINLSRKLLGRDPVGLTFTSTPEAIQAMQSGEIQKLEGGIEELSFGQFSDECYAEIAENMQIGSVFGIGFSLKNELLGAATFIVHEGFELGDRNAITAFTGQASVALQRRQAETELRKSEERLNLAIEGANLGIWDSNLQTGKVIFSPGWTRMLGYSNDDLDHDIIAWKDLIHPDDLLPVLKTRDEHIRGITPHYEAEYRLRARDGTWRWIHAVGKVTVWDLDRKPLRMTGVHIDITEKRKTEDALRGVNAKLNLLNDITRHDILNQITAILGYADLIEENVAGETETSQYLSRIKMMAEMIQEQITFTRYFQDLGTKEPEWQHGESVIRRAAMLAIPGDTSLTFTTGIPEIYADPLLEKALYNLLENAIRHGENATMISVSFYEADGGGVLILEDNGVGISADNKDRIFEKKFGKNTGYGLFLTKEILSITGISIRETGEEGKGARFEILVPKGNYRKKEQ